MLHVLIPDHRELEVFSSYWKSAKIVASREFVNIATTHL